MAQFEQGTHFLAQAFLVGDVAEGGGVISYQNHDKFGMDPAGHQVGTILTHDGNPAIHQGLSFEQSGH
jgi:hypothetical protein